MTMAESVSEATPNATRHHQEKVGIVTSAKMQKTIVVEVRRRVAHPMYKRIMTKRSKFMAHDEHGKAKEGDTVRIVETRPLSKGKRWALKQVIRAAAVPASVTQ
jgi:small subunit ribosomal protein S17